MCPPRIVAPRAEAASTCTVHTALCSALAPAHLGAVSLVYCYASISALGPCSCIAYVPFIARIWLRCFMPFGFHLFLPFSLAGISHSISTYFCVFAQTSLCRFMHALAYAHAPSTPYLGRTPDLGSFIACIPCNSVQVKASRRRFAKSITS